MIKLQEIETELMDDLRELVDEVRYMSNYAKTEQTAESMYEIRQALIKTGDSVIEHDLEQFNDDWQELKYLLVDLDNAILEEQNKASELGRKSPSLNKLDKSLMDVYTFQVWSIDRLTNQPVVY